MITDIAGDNDGIQRGCCEGIERKDSAGRVVKGELLRLQHCSLTRIPRTEHHFSTCEPHQLHHFSYASSSPDSSAPVRQGWPGDSHHRIRSDGYECRIWLTRVCPNLPLLPARPLYGMLTCPDSSDEERLKPLDRAWELGCTS